MSHFDVSTLFTEQAASPTPTVVRELLIGTSDYSSRVTRWPKITKKWNDIRPTVLTIGLANEDQAFNFLRDDPTNLRSIVDVKMGFFIPASDANELVTLFSGTIDRVKFARGQASISVQDKIKPFTERIAGSSDVPVEFVGSNYLPSDIAWWLCTSFGGLSAVESTSNVDIDFESFSEWANVFSEDSVFVQARYEGKKVNEALRSLGRYTGSTISVENNKLTFNRFTAISSENTNLDTEIKAVSLLVDDSIIMNRFHTFADYDVSSDVWNMDVLAENSISVESYGLRELVEKDKTIWYADSVSALNFSQRMISTNGIPFDQYEIEIPLVALSRQLGESITFTDSFFGEDSVSVYRIMKYRIDVDRGGMSLTVDKSQSLTPFVLDDAVNGLLDQDYNFLL